MKYSLFILVGLMITGCRATKAPDRLTVRLDSLWAGEFGQNEPGGSILILKDGKQVYQRNYGLANLETKEPITEKTLFNTGSISKTFVSNGILILQERGLLSVEDSIDKYFDDFKNPEIAKRVKIKHMLSHTSGLPDLRGVEDNPAFFLHAKDVENFAPLKQADSLRFQPGEKFEYSNPSFNGLALIIEKVSGKQWQKFITENIFDPAGMSSSKITDGPYPQDGVAHAYDFNGTTFVENDYGEFPTFAAAGNGGVWSSVTELARYWKAIKEADFLNQRLILESRQPFRSENWKDTRKPFVGYSWFLEKDFLFGKNHGIDLEYIYHTGSQGGFRSFYIEIPSKDILLIGLFNKPLKNFRKIVLETNLILKDNNWLEE